MNANRDPLRCINTWAIQISNILQRNPERRHSSMNRRNLGTMAGGALGIPAIWIQVAHAEIGIAEKYTYNRHSITP